MGTCCSPTQPAQSSQIAKVGICGADSLDGSSNEKELRQYEKWSAEEEHIFFLKLSTLSKLSLLDGFISIAQHLPKKNRDQVTGTCMLVLQAVVPANA